MADSAALLVDDILPHKPMRQWVLSFPFPLRFLFASNPKAMSGVLGIVYRAIATHLAHKAGIAATTAKSGAVTLIQRFGGALNLNIHFHMLFLDGRVRYELKTPWRNGTTHVIFEPLDFMFRTNGMPRAQEAHDCREAGGRVTQEQLPRSGHIQIDFTGPETKG